jgi:hypothetical protein
MLPRTQDGPDPVSVHRSAPLPDLVVVTGATERREPIDTEVSLGREPGNTVALDDGYLSRHHCKVARRGKRISIVDLRSYNGTFVNGQKIHEECFLGPGDVVKIGRTTLFVDWKDGAADSQGFRVQLPDNKPHDAVVQVMKSSSPDVPLAYRDATLAAEAVARGPRTPSVEESRDPLAQTLKSRRELQDKKTPVPPPALEESAVARSGSQSSSSRSKSGLSREREGVRLIAQISRVLPSVDDEGEFLDLVLAKVLEVIPAERGLVMRLDPSRKGLYVASVKNAVPGRDDQAARRLGISHTIAKKVIRERVSVLVDDVKLDPRFKAASSLHDLDVRSVLAVPIWLGEEHVTGLIYLDHLLEGYMFTESDRELLHAVANLVALVLARGKS